LHYGSGQPPNSTADFGPFPVEKESAGSHIFDVFPVKGGAAFWAAKLRQPQQGVTALRTPGFFCWHHGGRFEQGENPGTASCLRSRFGDVSAKVSTPWLCEETPGNISPNYPTSARDRIRAMQPTQPQVKLVSGGDPSAFALRNSSSDGLLGDHSGGGTDVMRGVGRGQHTETAWAILDLR